MHGLVQWVVRERLQPTVPNCSALIEGITNLLRRLYADDPLSTQPYINYADELVKHVKEEENGPITKLYADIAVIYGALGDQEKRLAYDLKALSIREQTLSATHPDLATSYNNIAMTYYDRNALDKALFYMKKAVAIREQILPANHPDRISSRKSLAVIEKAIDDQNEPPG